MKDSLFLRDDLLEFSSRLDSENHNVKAYRKRNRSSHHKQKLLQSTEVLSELTRAQPPITQGGNQGLSARRLSATAAVGKRPRTDRELPGFTKTARTKQHSGLEEGMFQQGRTIANLRADPSLGNSVPLQSYASPSPSPTTTPLRHGSFSKQQRQFAKGGLKNKHLQNWLNQILLEYCHEQKFDATIEHPALKKYGIDKNSLLSKGINPGNLERIYKSLFVYSMGFNTLLRQIGGRNMNLRKTFWKVYAILLEYCSDGDFDTMIGQIERDKTRKMEVLKEEIERRQELIDNNEDIHQQRNAKIFKELKLLRDQNQDLQNDKNVLMEDYKQAEQAFNEEVSLRLKFQNKINQIHGVHRELAIKHQKLYDDLQLRTFELTNLKDKHTRLVEQHLTAKTDNQFLRKENAALKEENEFNYGLMEDMKKKTTGHELLQVEWRHKKQEFAIALREREKRVEQIKAQLKNAQLMVQMKEKSQASLQKEYKRALQQNKQLVSSLQKELQHINAFMLQKKDFNDTHSRLYAEVQVTAKQLAQKNEQLLQQKQQIQSLNEQLRMKSIDNEVLSGKVRQHEIDMQDLYSKIAEMKKIKTVIQEELTQAKSREEYYRNYYAQKEKVITQLTRKAEEDERIISQFSLARKALQSKVALLTQKLSAQQQTNKKKSQKLSNQIRNLDKQNRQLKAQLEERLNEVQRATAMYQDTFAKLKDQLFQRNDLELRYNQSLTVVESETDHIKKLNIRISQLQERCEDYARKLKGAQFVLQNREKSFQNELHSHQTATHQLKEQLRQRKMYVHPMKVEDLLAQTRRLAEVRERQRMQNEQEKKKLNVAAMQAKIKHLQAEIFEERISHQQALQRKERELQAERERANELQERCERIQVIDTSSNVPQGDQPIKGYFKQKQRKYLEIIRQKTTRVQALLKQVQSMHDQNNSLISRLSQIQQQSKLKQSKLSAIQSQFSQLQAQKHALNMQRTNVFREKERLLAQMAEQESKVLDEDRNFLGVQSTGRETHSRQRSTRLESREESREKNIQPGWRNDFGKKVKNAFNYYHK